MEQRRFSVAMLARRFAMDACPQFFQAIPEIP